MFAKPFKIQRKANSYVLFYGGDKLGQINKEVVHSFLADVAKDGGFIPRVGRKKKSTTRTKNKTPSQLRIKATQLARLYAKTKAQFFKTKKVRAVTEADAQFQHFVEAVKIMRRHKVRSYRLFLRAQIDGLRYINKGKGIFPHVANLGTEAAETRLLEYVQGVKDEEGNVVRVELTDEDKNTPLNDNSRYTFRRKRVKDQTASLEEAVYVKELQMIRRGKVEDYVTAYLNKLADN